MKTIICMVISIAAIGCANSQKSIKPSPETNPDKVLSRIDGMEARPSWLVESQPFRVSNGKVISLGQVSIPASHRLSAAYRICNNNAKQGIASAIEEKLEYIFQQSSDSTELDNGTAKFIGAELSSLVSSAIRPESRYYEKVATTNDYGERQTLYKVYCTVAMPEIQFKSKVAQAIKKAESNGRLGPSFHKQVDRHWGSFTSNAIQPTPETVADATK